MLCLQRASARAYGTSYHGVATGCLRCLVVSDSKAVLRCAAASLDRPLRVAGAPIQLVGNANDATLSTPTNIEKVFVDWMLLARSVGAIKLGSSAFLQTALNMRWATASWAFTIDAQNMSEMLHPDGRWRSICEGRRRPTPRDPAALCVTPAQRALNPKCRGKDKYW